MQIKFINRRPYHLQCQSSVEVFNKYIQNALISEKDHKKEEFDLEETINDFYNIIIQKFIVQ